MLRKTAKEDSKNWDKLLPYLLFAYRDVPQASTGFSPFELLYGRQVRGPLDMLKERWESSSQSSECRLLCDCYERKDGEDEGASTRELNDSTKTTEAVV